jgi:hypothetical protein
MLLSRIVAIRRRWWVIGASVVTLFVVGALMLAARMPFSSDRLKDRVVSTLEQRMDADVELGELTVRLLPTIRVRGSALKIRHKGRRDVPPLFSVDTFTVEGDVVGMWRRHVRRVRLDGLDIQIPPRPHPEDAVGTPQAEPPPSTAVQAAAAPPDAASAEAYGLPLKQVVIDELVAEEAKLTLVRRTQDRPPRMWQLHHLHVFDVGLGHRMPFRSVLTNAVPPGEIQTNGAFGPWHSDEPGDTPLDGDFTFEHADLSVFKGIAGILSARGNYGGTLDRIDVRGQTETPEFMVTVSKHAVPLTTNYHAIIDGTNGDTTLERIDAKFLNTSLVAQGGVYDLPGPAGRRVTLNITMDDGRLEDVMRLAVPTPRPPMTGALRLRTKFDLPPGDKDVVEKLLLDGRFVINGGRFTDRGVQQKIVELSTRARGNAKNASDQPAAPGVVTSDFAGRFSLGHGLLRLPTVTFDVPGAAIQLAGQYALERETIAFVGNLYMDAKISQTVSGWKSWLLKVVDPLFRKDGRTVVPIRISGTRNDPQFGVDVKRVFNKDDTPVPPSKRAPANPKGGGNKPPEKPVDGSDSRKTVPTTGQAKASAGR